MRGGRPKAVTAVTAVTAGKQQAADAKTQGTRVFQIQQGADVSSGVNCRPFPFSLFPFPRVFSAFNYCHAAAKEKEKKKQKAEKEVENGKQSKLRHPKTRKPEKHGCVAQTLLLRGAVSATSLLTITIKTNNTYTEHRTTLIVQYIKYTLTYPVFG